MRGDICLRMRSIFFLFILKKAKEKPFRKKVPHRIVSLPPHNIIYDIIFKYICVYIFNLMFCLLLSIFVVKKKN